MSYNPTFLTLCKVIHLFLCIFLNLEQAINDKIMSLNLRNCFTEIETVDSQVSYQDGVFCVVTGTFTGQDNVQRRFAQSFFLAPQESGGYFVLNDVFRFLNETNCKEMNQNTSYGGKVDDPKGQLTPEEYNVVIYPCFF